MIEQRQYAMSQSWIALAVALLLAVVAAFPAPVFAEEEEEEAREYCKLTITFNKNDNGAVGTMDKAVYTADMTGAAATLPPVAFTKIGYAFTGWNTNQAGTKTAYPDQADITALLAKYLDEDYDGEERTQTLYAQWAVVSYPITYHLNGGAAPAENPATYTVEDAFALAEPARGGYEFGGWFTNSTFTRAAAPVAKGTTGALAFYAKWIKPAAKEYKATATSAVLNTYGGNGTNRVSVIATVKKRVKSSDRYYYLMSLDPVSGKPLSVIGQAYKDKKVAYTFNLRSDPSALFQRVAIAVRQGKNYTLISAPKFIKNPEKAAAEKTPYTIPRTKKGLQVSHPYQVSELGCGTVYMNVPVSHVMNGNVPFTYGGKTYYFKKLNTLWWVDTFNGDGANVTVQIQLDWGDGSYKDLIAKEARSPGHRYYQWNTKDAKARAKMEALFCYLAREFNEGGRHVDNWILGNEVNSCNVWNWKGSMSFDKYVESYALAYRALYMAARQASSESKAFICLDHCWNTAEAGYTSKAFLDAFGAKIKKIQSNINWNVAFHPYPNSLYATAFWNNKGITTKTSTPYINMKNLSVLTNYVKKKWGTKTRVILSELAYTMGSGAGEDTQAAAIAYSYYIAACNPMVDAIIFRSYGDEPGEVAEGFRFGINTRKAYDVFKYMDTAEGHAHVDGYRTVIGKKSWAKLVPGYKEGRLTGFYRKA